MPVLYYNMGRVHEEEGSGRVQIGHCRQTEQVAMREGREIGKREQKGHESKGPREWQRQKG